MMTGATAESAAWICGITVAASPLTVCTMDVRAGPIDSIMDAPMASIEERKPSFVV